MPLFPSWGVLGYLTHPFKQKNNTTQHPGSPSLVLLEEEARSIRDEPEPPTLVPWAIGFLREGEFMGGVGT